MNQIVFSALTDTTTHNGNRKSPPICAESIRVTGIVQGVGFRPTVWRLANKNALAGKVINDGQGVLIHVWGTAQAIDRFVNQLKTQSPPLARIDQIKRQILTHDQPYNDFRIDASDATTVQTAVSPDASTCQACMADVNDPFGRRFRYPLTNCTHCGPRFSIIKTIPYDRANTSMHPFKLCPSCQQEYNSPKDRRFHAQPNACYDCGPQVELARIDGNPICLESLTQLDAVDGACTLLQNGAIIAIKSIGGFHLACDATNAKAVETLRKRKQRYAKPFALMARDLTIIERYALVTEVEKQLLESNEAPIVLLEKREQPPTDRVRKFGVAEGNHIKDLQPIAKSVAPGQNTLGFMLPYTPLHQLMLKRMNRPIILTSANRSDEPQVIDNEEIKERLGSIAEYVLWHNRDIVNRVDDSVVRLMRSKPCTLRRARGYAPIPLPLPGGFDNAAEILAMGGELKNTFCLIKNDQAILSQHMGDLENAETYLDYKKNLTLYGKLFQHQAKAIAIDAHPEYLSSKLGWDYAEQLQVPLQEIQHHHAHIAACMTENQLPLDTEPVLGVALDGIGYGADGSFWGGEFLKTDYTSFERLGTFKPVAMLGGTQAMHEPWRNTYAHLMAEMGWPAYQINYGELELTNFFQQQPLSTFNAMLKNNLNSPLASSCGRLFDAVAAAIGICCEHAHYEGQAAVELEAIVDQHTLQHEDDNLAYPFAIPRLPDNGLPYVEPLAMWQALLGDLILKTPAPIISARFHKGLAKIIVSMIHKLTTEQGERIIQSVVLSGGVFQNKTLLEAVVERLQRLDYHVLTHQHIPTNDGGLALGQAVIAAANILQTKATRN